MRRKFFSFLALTLLLLIGLSQSVYAAEPVLNQATDNPLVGDETTFVGLIDLKTGVSYSDIVDLEAGRFYAVNITVTNDTVGTIARNVRIRTAFPEQMGANDVATLWSEVSADNTASEWPLGRGVTLRTEQPVQIKLVGDYGVLCSGGDVNATEIDATELRSEDGVLVGYDARDGKLPGGAKYTVQLIYYLYVAPLAVESMPTSNTEALA